MLPAPCASARATTASTIVPSAVSATRARSNGPVQVVSYRHLDKRTNNPEVGMVHPENDPDQPRTTYAYDPHIDPALMFDTARARIETVIDDALASGDADTMKEALLELKRMQAPYLNWAGKAERTSFEIDTVSLHVHERVDPATILANARKRLKDEKAGEVVHGVRAVSARSPAPPPGYGRRRPRCCRGGGRSGRGRGAR